MSSAQSSRPFRGNNIIAFPDDYTVIDLETTGLSPDYDTIIEVAAIRVRGGEIVDRYSSLVQTTTYIDGLITHITGITTEMILGAPLPEEVFPVFREFVGHDIVVGHHVSFDVSFLYEEFAHRFGEPFTNNYVDTLRISKKLLPELEHHRLCDITEALHVNADNAHRALGDCESTAECYRIMREMVEQAEGVEAFPYRFKKKQFNPHKDLHSVSSEIALDETHPLFGKHCVFTGTLERMARKDAAQAVVDVGGICDSSVTAVTNYLILGNNDYCKSIKDGKSAKQKKAENLKMKGQDIEIVPENVFYEMLAYSGESVQGG